MPKEPTPGPFLLRWWPIITFLAAWLAVGIGGFYSVRTDLSTAQMHVTAIELALNNHEDRQQRERAELLAEIRELRQDVKTLLGRSSK